MLPGMASTPVNTLNQLWVMDVRNHISVYPGLVCIRIFW
jgi:hypothetical protein